MAMLSASEAPVVMVGSVSGSGRPGREAAICSRSARLPLVSSYWLSPSRSCPAAAVRAACGGRGGAGPPGEVQGAQFRAQVEELREGAGRQGADACGAVRQGAPGRGHGGHVVS
nr:hypothetical protein [Streptomyces broussonetiae]